jgi:hypothetical protein
MVTASVVVMSKAPKTSRPACAAPLIVTPSVIWTE